MKTKHPSRFGLGHFVGALVDVGFFVLLALLFRAHWILGLVAGGVLLLVESDFMLRPGMLFRGGKGSGWNFASFARTKAA